jgi:hypothetical protein
VRKRCRGRSQTKANAGIGRETKGYVLIGISLKIDWFLFLTVTNT